MAHDKKWDEFHGACVDDPAHIAEGELIRAWVKYGNAVVYSTARTENFRDETELWLKHNNLPWGPLYMRKHGDDAPSAVLKKATLMELKSKGHTLAFAMDDNATVVAMYRSEGITCIQPRVEPGRHDTGVPALLMKAEQTYRDRRFVYGQSEMKFGSVMKALFPDGMEIRSHKDWVRIGLLTQIISKLCRYSSTPGHIDSIHDAGVYSFMLENEDRKDG